MTDRQDAPVANASSPAEEIAVRVTRLPPSAGCLVRHEPASVHRIPFGVVVAWATGHRRMCMG